MALNNKKSKVSFYKKIWQILKSELKGERTQETKYLLIFYWRGSLTARSDLFLQFSLSIVIYSQMHMLDTDVYARELTEYWYCIWVTCVDIIIKKQLWLRQHQEYIDSQFERTVHCGASGVRKYGVMNECARVAFCILFILKPTPCEIITSSVDLTNST